MCVHSIARRHRRMECDIVNCCTRFDEYFAINRNICTFKQIKCPMLPLGCVCLFFFLLPFSAVFVILFPLTCMFLLLLPLLLLNPVTLECD